MFDLIKAIFKYHRGAVSALALLHIFTFIPASMVFWMQGDSQVHLVYYAFIAAVAILASWVLHWVTRDAKAVVKHYMTKMEIIFALAAVLSAPFLLTFYFYTAVFFSNFFEEVYSFSYFGPGRIVSAAIVFAFYNLFFIGDLAAAFKKKKIISTQQ